MHRCGWFGGVAEYCIGSVLMCVCVVCVCVCVCGVCVCVVCVCVVHCSESSAPERRFGCTHSSVLLKMKWTASSLSRLIPVK
jgi:hypothetical protein